MTSIASVVRRDRIPDLRRATSPLLRTVLDLERVVDDADGMRLPNNAAIALVNQTGSHPLYLSLANNPYRGSRKGPEAAAGLSVLTSARLVARVRTLGGLKHTMAEFFRSGASLTTPLRWIDENGNSCRPGCVGFMSGRPAGITFDCG